MGIRKCDSSSIMELGGYIDTCIRNRPGEPRELTAVIIDNMPPSGKGSYVSFLKERFNCQHIMQDRWHIDHNFTVSANNMHKNYHNDNNIHNNNNNDNNKHINNSNTTTTTTTTTKQQQQQQ